MNKILRFLLLLFFGSVLFAQQTIKLTPDDFISIPHQLKNKIGSGELIRVVSEKQLAYKLDPEQNYSANSIQAVIYLDHFRSQVELTKYKSRGLNYIGSSWTSPVFDHPNGFIIAEITLEKFIEVLALDFIERIDLAEQICYPQNNEADKILNADDVWLQGWTGNGIKVAVLDSGLDSEPSNSDLPSSIIKKDYSSYPTLDDDVENQVTGHGTHVTGSVLGRGILSNGNIGNGGNPYTGVAPSAELVFLKIGNDYSAGASTNVIINAMDAAVNLYDVNIISMSYGGWDTYHDGTSSKDQKVDWCYSQGVPVFLAAGNSGELRRHYSGTVNSNSTTDYIEVTVTNALDLRTSLYFNLVWFDGLGVNNNLTLKYYDESFQEITDIYYYQQTESTRGTESQYSQVLHKLPAGNGTYYLKIENQSEVSQEFHIYESYNDGKVTFANPDPNYTIVSPATATYGFCVGAFTSRDQWTDYNGLNHSFNQTLDQIMSFSSRGPRIDGFQKPDLVAPGSAIISIRDRDVITTPDVYWIDNDGNTTGDANYYVMQGTSMAAPQCAGAAALYLDKFPGATPSQLYNALRNNAISDEFTQSTPNNDYGYGKLDIFAAISSSGPLPVELASFTANVITEGVQLNWITETEVNNYGFEVQKLETRSQNFEFVSIGFVEGYGNSNSSKEYTFIDESLIEGEYSYRLKQVDNDGNYEYSELVEVVVGFPEEFSLEQNYPNPFNPSTTIKFSLPDAGFVTLKVYNLMGEEIETLINKDMQAGNYNEVFNPVSLASGVYLYRLSSGVYSQTKKMQFLK